MDIRYPNHPDDSRQYDTEQLRRHYLQERVFIPDELPWTYSHVDRIMFGGAMPVKKVLRLEADRKEMGVETFLERREMGVINIGGPGTVTLDGAAYKLGRKDGLYIPMGIKEVLFSSDDAQNPAKFYLNSAPAHHAYPVCLIDKDTATSVPLGEDDKLNRRVLHQYLHPAVCQTCQLSMGMTELAPRNVWNTMPCHTHERRMEVYFYFDLPSEEDRIFHFMGQPQQTRHIIMKNEQAVISPSWSIHCAAATANYTFIWGMCGENQTFDDMDVVPMEQLR